MAALLNVFSSKLTQLLFHNFGRDLHAANSLVAARKRPRQGLVFGLFGVLKIALAYSFRAAPWRHSTARFRRIKPLR